MEFALEFDGVTHGPVRQHQGRVLGRDRDQPQRLGLSFNMALETGGVVVSEKIRIDLDIQLVRS